jgi:predicted ester cyclase
MASQEIIDKLIWAQEETIHNGNIDAMDEFSHPDLVFRMYPFPEVRGLVNVKEKLAAFGEAFSEERIHFDEIISEGDTIAVRYHLTAKHTAKTPLFPAEPTGKEVVLRGAFFVRVENGMEVEVNEYDDILGLYQQMGLVPTP